MKSIAKLTLEHKQDKEGQHKTDKKILLSFGVAFSYTTEFSDCRFSAVFFSIGIHSSQNWADTIQQGDAREKKKWKAYNATD